MKKTLAVAILAVVIAAAAFTKLAGGNEDRCAHCHAGIEKISGSHGFPCSDCHGGDNSSKITDTAHAGMHGGKNPSAVEVWDKTCGKCHEYQVKIASSTIMLTNTGMIKNTQAAWGEEVSALYSVMEEESFDKSGYPLTLYGAEKLDTMAGELYRKFCAACHVAGADDSGYMSHRSSGCAACHFSYNETGKYKGTDKTVYDKQSYSITHAMNRLPDDDVCMSCHNRSGRIALSYRGLYDGNNSMVPTKYGDPGPIIHSGIRSIRNMKPDVHHEGGMECIDCHTQAEIMGDGYAYENMYNQLEISCESCHGDGENLPGTQPALREMNRAFANSASYTAQVPNGAEMVLTAKGRTFSNVFGQNGSYWLVGKRSGAVKEVKTVKDTPEHNVTGHGRMECVTCHSRVVIQCYGCHTQYDERRTQYDYIKKEFLPGQFTETEDLRTFYPFPLAINQRGKVSPMTPGCQTFFTYIDITGAKVKEGFVFDFRGTKRLKFAPFFSHNVGKKAIGCADCHGNPMFYGYGDGLYSSATDTLTSSIICDNCELPLNALYSIIDGRRNMTSDIVRENSRIFTDTEIAKIIGANRCIVCHDRADARYYGKEINYDKILNDTVHKPLLR